MNFLFSSKKHLLIYLIIILGFAVFIYNCYSVFNYLMDDFFSALRYARNLVDYGYLSGNPGEHFNGIHDYFYVLVMAMIYWLFHNPETLHIKMKLFLILCGFLCILLPLIKNQPKSELNNIGKIWYVIALSTATPFVLWCSAGFGTALLALEVLLIFLLYLNSDSSINRCLMFFMLVLLIFTRLDMIILAASIAFIVVFELNTKSLREIFSKNLCFVSINERYFAEFILFTAIPALTVFIIIFLYYGTIMPEPAFKAGGLNTGRFVWGVLNFIEFLTINFNFIHVIIIGYLVWKIRKIPSPTVMFLIGLLPYLFYVFGIGEIHMLHDYRMYVSLIPVFYFASASGVTLLAQQKRLKTGKFKIAKAVLLVLVIIFLFNEYVNLYYIKWDSLRLNTISRYGPLESNIDSNSQSIKAWMNVINYIRKHFDRKSTVLVTNYMSMTSYFTNFYTLDIGGWCINSYNDCSRLITSSQNQNCHSKNKFAISIDHIWFNHLYELPKFFKKYKGRLIYYSVGTDNDSRSNKFKYIYKGKEGRGYIVWFAYLNKYLTGKFCMDGI